MLLKNFSGLFVFKLIESINFWSSALKKGLIFFSVPNSKGIVCNIGDMMQLITEGNLKSTPHRVVEYSANDSKSRYSMPFFLHPSPDVVLKSVYNEDDKGVLAHDFLEERVKAIKLY